MKRAVLKRAKIFQLLSVHDRQTGNGVFTWPSGDRNGQVESQMSLTNVSEQDMNETSQRSCFMVTAYTTSQMEGCFVSGGVNDQRVVDACIFSQMVR